MTEKIELRPVLNFNCPCGQPVTVANDDKSDTPCILHGQPMCDDFERLDPVSYLRWIREDVEKKLGKPS